MLGPVEHLHPETVVVAVVVVVVVVVVAGDGVVVLVLDVPHHDQDWRGSGRSAVRCGTAVAGSRHNACLR